MKKELLEKESEFLPKGLFPLYKPQPPFMPFEYGFGYMGVILQDIQSGKIQCHYCGKLFRSVGRHIQHEHDMTVDKYREEVGLYRSTPLVCSGTSQLIRKNYYSLPSEEREERIELLRNNNKEVVEKYAGTIRTRIKSRIQYHNKFGTCDLQAKALFYKEWKELGRIPGSEDASSKLKWLVYDRIGSWDKALQLWGVSEKDMINYHKYKDERMHSKKYRPTFENRKGSDIKYTKVGVINSIKAFVMTEGRMPSHTEIDRTILPSTSTLHKLFGTESLEKIAELIK
jgi:hypothetical protein